MDLLGASEASIRRDINALAEQGELQRVRGGAESFTADSRKLRLSSAMIVAPLSRVTTLISDSGAQHSGPRQRQMKLSAVSLSPLPVYRATFG